MKLRTHYNSCFSSKGFIAVTAILLLALSSIAYSLVVLGSAVMYSDIVDKRELRIQANMNADSCLETVKLMLKKDNFLHGESSIKDFGCKAKVVRNQDNNSLIRVQTSLEGVSSGIIEEVINRF